MADISKKFEKTIFQDQFPPEVVQPLAQLIMLDANHGDSNVIDMCVEDLQNGRYVGKSWRRFLIDVGPDVNAVNRNVIRVIVAYKFPIGPGGDQPLGDDVEPKIQMVQFTHTDEDHSGGACALLKALAWEPALQRHFVNTQLAYHRLPQQNPEWSLNLEITASNQRRKYPYTIVCASERWADFGADLKDGDYNVSLSYNFTVNNLRVAESPSPRLLITKWDIDTPNELTVKCVVSLSRRKNVGRTNQPVEFNMRKAHLEMFTVTRTYDITDGVRAGQRTLALSNKRKVISKKKKDEDKKKPRYDPVTRQLVPPGEKKRADQPYHRIEEELAKIRRDHASRIPPLLDAKVSSPVQGHVERMELATVNIVGPTKRIHEEFIGDCVRVEYDQGSVKAIPDVQDAHSKDGVLHNMASIVTLFRRWTNVFGAVVAGSTPLLSMIYTGDAHDRECQIRDTVLDYAGTMPPRTVDVLKIPHHGSLCSTSVEFYNRVNARVYLICAKQNTHGLPTLPILKAIVSHTAKFGNPGAHLFFSNPDSLWNLPSSSAPSDGAPSNVNLLLSEEFKPGAKCRGTVGGTYNYTCYIMKHRLSQWRWDKTSEEKNAGIILLGNDKNGKLVITASEKWWDIWDEKRINQANPADVDRLASYRKLR